MKFVIALSLLLFVTSAHSLELTCHQLFARTLSRAEIDGDWGVLLFKPGNPGFREPEYLSLLQEAADPYLHGHYARTGRAVRLTREISERFLYFWHQLASKPSGTPSESYRTVIRGLESSGTEANYAVVKEVKYNFKRKQEAREHASINNLRRKNLQPEVIAINDNYSHFVTDRFEQLPFKSRKKMTDAFRDPLTLSPEDRKNLEHLRGVFTDPGRRIAGIFLEVFSNGFYSLETFHPAFLRELRILADEFNVAIIADEIFVGLGRTGKFWSFEHFPGFVPDYLTFGKGLMLSGYAQVRRHKEGAANVTGIMYDGSEPFYSRHKDFSGPPSTIAVSGLLVLQASQVLKIIFENNLVDNARDVGAYFLEQAARPNGIIGLKHGAEGLGLHLKWDRRLSPPLDLTKEDADGILRSGNLGW